MRSYGFIFAVVFFVVACSEKSNNPYLNDPQAAKTTLQECHAELMKAAETDNRQQMQALSENQDCIYASEAHTLHVQEGKIERMEPLVAHPPGNPIQDIKDAASANQEEVVEPLPVSNSTDPEHYRAMPFEEYYLWSKRCLSSVVERRTEKCEVIRGLIDERYAVEIDKLRERFEGKPKELEIFSRSVCMGEDVVDYLCEFSLKIMKEQKS